ncbi:MAG: cytochrome c-550 PedF [Gammaproteobacteria bacterium]|nr:cytochrome c-550 PedF [Gammaproteobacteria bacterium]
MLKKVQRQVAVAAFLAAGAVGTAMGHGDVAPQAVDTKHLPQLGEDWLDVNPYRGNGDAEKTGSSAYNQNCARCHGLGAVSGGIAPDLRYLPPEDEGDEWFLYRLRNGAIRNGITYMPSFEGILSQEAMWSIRAWLVTLPKDE